MVVSDDGAPKSAYELAMARLREKDREAGVEDREVSQELKAEIAEVGRVYQAKLAELEILHRSKLAATHDYAAREALEADYLRDRERIVSEREAKIEKVRSDKR
jgi:hypothetical protein